MEAVVAVYSDWGIGAQGTQPLVVPADRVRFRELTTGHAVIVGRKTLGDFPGGRPLKNRHNIVITRPNSTIDGAEVVHDMEEAMELAKAHDRCFVIGGASVYEALLEYCDTAFVTKTYVEPAADRFFPNLDQLPNWQIAEQSEIFEENGVTYQYIDYINTAPKALP